ncbi:YcfL family protein [Sulfurimonas sp.]|nr:YcfL family protein [Sulfurimonas sp.]
MKLVWISILTLIAFSGCNKSPEPENAIVKVVNECGNSDISITDIKGRKKSDGFMQAQVIGENSSGKYQTLEYRIAWFDKSGFKIDSILSNWRTSPAYENQPFHLNETSPSTKARTFRLYIRKDKDIICNRHYIGQ